MKKWDPPFHILVNESPFLNKITFDRTKKTPCIIYIIYASYPNSSGLNFTVKTKAVFDLSSSSYFLISQGLETGFAT